MGIQSEAAPCKGTDGARQPQQNAELACQPSRSKSKKSVWVGVGRDGVNSGALWASRARDRHQEAHTTGAWSPILLKSRAGGWEAQVKAGATSCFFATEKIERHVLLWHEEWIVQTTHGHQPRGNREGRPLSTGSALRIREFGLGCQGSARAVPPFPTHTTHTPQTPGVFVDVYSSFVVRFHQNQKIETLNFFATSGFCNENFVSQQQLHTTLGGRRRWLRRRAPPGSHVASAPTTLCLLERSARYMMIPDRRRLRMRARTRMSLVLKMLCVREVVPTTTTMTVFNQGHHLSSDSRRFTHSNQEHLIDFCA